MASLVASTPAHASGAVAVTLGAAVQSGDVIVVYLAGAGGSAAPTSCGDSLLNTYTLQQTELASSGNTNMAVFTASVTNAGTPLITIVGNTWGGIGITAFAFRGFSSATAHKKGVTSETTSNPQTVSLTTTVTCTGVAIWANINTDVFTSFTLSGTTILHNTGIKDACGYLLGQAAGTYAFGENFSSGDADSSTIALWFQETASVVTDEDAAYNIPRPPLAEQIVSVWEGSA